MPLPSQPLRNRREALTLLGGLGLLAACSSTVRRTAIVPSITAPTSTPSATSTTSTTTTAATTTVATTSTTSPTTTIAATTTAATAAGPVASRPASCQRTPELDEGPYYLPLDLVRRDITDGHPGAALTLHITVVDVNGCAPMAGSAVDVWHCDAAGAYSGIDARTKGQTFMRGTQITDATGAVEFVTVYPGWYPGRTVHVHVKVRDAKTARHTGQLFFPDDITDQVYANAPYAQRGRRSTSNGRDSIFGRGGASQLVTVAPNGDGFVASVVTIVVPG